MSILTATTETAGGTIWRTPGKPVLAVEERKELRTLDRYLCQSLGVRMVRLSENADTWPGNISPSLQEWCVTLREHGDVLVWYSERELSDEYEALASAFEKTPINESEIEKLKLEAYNRDELDTARAQASLRWVSEVLPHLWG